MTSREKLLQDYELGLRTLFAELGLDAPAASRAAPAPGRLRKAWRALRRWWLGPSIGDILAANTPSTDDIVAASVARFAATTDDAAADAIIAAGGMETVLRSMRNDMRAAGFHAPDRASAATFN